MKTTLFIKKSKGNTFWYANMIISADIFWSMAGIPYIVLSIADIHHIYLG